MINPRATLKAMFRSSDINEHQSQATSKKARRANRRRGLRMESLEQRNLLAGLISEVADDVFDKYIELRGEPNQTLPSGSYVTVVESTEGLGGRIDMVIDLSGQSYGDNGFLVIAAQGLTQNIDSQANALVSDASGFSGLPDGIHSGGTFTVFTPSVFFFQSAVPPLVGDDIDVGSNGLIDPDGPVSTWNIYDSVTMGTIHDYYGYGKTVIGRQSAQRSLQTDSTFVETAEGSGDRLTYVARIGDSTGPGSNDWVGGYLYDEFSDDFGLRLAHGFVDESATPLAFSGRELDHVGTYNFFGGVRGVVFNDNTGMPVPGVTVLADTNGNGLRDLIETTIEPDNYLPSQELTNVTPGATLTVGGFTSDFPDDTVYAGTTTIGLSSTGTRVFSDDFSNSNFDVNNKLRIDFYRPADEVLIDVIGRSIFSIGNAVMEAFDDAGNSLGVVRSGALSQGTRQQIQIAPIGGGISYALIYEEFGLGSLLNFDRLVYRQREAVATTNAQGEYYLNYLTPGTYDVTIPVSANAILKSPVGGSEEVTIDFTEHFQVDFVFGENKAPIIDPEMLEMSIDENSLQNTSVGFVQASDPDAGQALRYRLIGGTGRRVFSLNQQTGEVRVNSSRGLDFEQVKDYTLVIEVSDNFEPRLSDQATITVSVNNINEAPKFATNEFALSEDASADITFGPIVASDDDALNDPVDPVDPVDPPANPNESIGLDSGKFTFAIDDDLFGDMFTIDPISGLITLVDPDPARLDFERSDTISLRVAATDQSLLPLTSYGEVVFNISDVNEPPTLGISEIFVPEDAIAGTVVATLPVVDPEDYQTHTLSIISGTGQSLFTLDSASGELRVADNVSFDAETQSEYDLLINVAELTESPLDTDNPLSIHITDVDEAPIVSITPALPISIDEGAAAGTVVATLSAVDPEGTAVVITQRTGTENFVFDHLTNQLKVAQGAVLDFEANAEMAVKLRFADSSFPPKFLDLDVAIRLNDVNEPAMLTTNTLSVPENSLSGVKLADVLATDPDAGDTVTFAIAGGTGTSIFNIDPISGALSLREGAELNFESDTQSYTLDVALTETKLLPGGETIELPAGEPEQITINVLDVNEPPTIVQPFQNLRILAGRHFCFEFGDEKFMDPDANSSFEIFVTTNAGLFPDWLSYDEESRQLRGTPTAADFATTSIIVRITDTGELPQPISAAFTINVVEAADAGVYIPVCVSTWQNPNDPLDVDANGTREPADVLKILNFLNRFGAQNVPHGESPVFFLDVDGDNVVRPLDALRVINGLNTASTAAGMLAADGEADDADVVDVALLELTPTSKRTPQSTQPSPLESANATDIALTNYDEDAGKDNLLPSVHKAIDDILQAAL